MNSNYQVNKLYAQERINSHLQVAEAHRLTQQSKGKNKPRIVVIAVARIYGEAGSMVRQAAQALAELVEVAASVRRPHLR